jgi:hypothetical protein
MISVETVLELLPEKSVTPQQATEIGEYFGIRVKVAKQLQTLIVGSLIAGLSSAITYLFKVNGNVASNTWLDALMTWIPMITLSLAMLFGFVCYMVYLIATLKLANMKLAPHTDRKVKELAKIMFMAAFFGSWLTRAAFKHIRRSSQS